jgi:DNA-3-methyladenine glycosylase II
VSPVKALDARSELAASDPVMARLIDELGELSVEARKRQRPAVDSFGALLRSIIGQQISTKAAATIHDRFLALFDGRTPTPAELGALGIDPLRGVGLSGRKAEYVLDLARHVETGELELDRLDQLSDDEVVAEISAVRGLGVWSAQMFLIFHLDREDVLPTGDLGIRKGAQIAYELDDPPSPAELTELAEPWRPHRTLASIYLWGILHNTPG